MNTQKSIYKKLFKEEVTELSSHQVELSIVDDFNKLSDNYFQQGQKFESKIQKIESSIKEMQNEFIALQKISSEIDSDYQKARRMSLELGIKIPDSIENNYKRVLASLKNDLATFKKYNK